MGRRPKAGPQLYDFRRPTKLSRDHTRILQIAYETFARQYTTLLTSTLRAIAQVSLISIEQLSYDEYVSALENPTLLSTINLEPLAGVMVHELSMQTAMTWVDHLLGGPGGANQPERQLTDIEEALVRGMLDRVLNELRYALDALGTLSLTLAGIEYNAQFAQACAASDTVVVASFEMKVGAVECVSTICLPFNAIAPRLEAAVGHGGLSDRQRESREAAAVAMAAGMETVPVDVAVRLRPTTMRPQQILELAVGDVVHLPHRSSTAMSVTAADVVFAHAVPGSQGSRLACLIVDPPEEENPA